MTDFSLISQRHTAVTQHSMVIFAQAAVCAEKRPIQVVKQIFHQGHLYQASFPPVKFQVPVPNANSVYLCTSPGETWMPVRNFELNP